MIEDNSLLKKCTMNCDLLRQITFTTLHIYSSIYKSKNSFNDI